MSNMPFWKEDFILGYISRFALLWIDVLFGRPASHAELYPPPKR